MKKSVVEARIKEAQDKIDNLTHNAWRPYLVSAEYINFDTYKPYRRRYYTDYVGTAPLLFRNVQQILRLELWQGDDYREICSAEARIHIPDDVRALSGAIVVSSGNGSAAELEIGTSSTQWRADFDPATSAQNLADLINKEDRVSKAAVEFAPPYQLEGSSSNINVDNEFLATANADYGTGIVKVTSMRAGKGGETCSIVTTDSNIQLKQTTNHKATITSVVSTTVNVDDTSSFAHAGVCVKGDTVFRYSAKTATSFTNCVIVRGSPLSDLSGEISQDTFTIDLQGGSSSGDNARLRDWWADYEMGIIYFNNSYPFFEWNAIKCSYIYGERYLEKAIEEAATKMVAIDVLMSDDRSVLIPEGTQNVDLTAKIQLLRAEVDSILARYVEIVCLSDNMSREQREFLDLLTEEMSDAKYQEELRALITQRPQVYREKVESQELGMSSIRKTDEGYKKGSQPAPQNEVDAALERADKRMLRESPMLIERKLVFKNGMLLPDKAAYMKVKAE